MGEPIELKGPDLALGVSLRDIPDQGSLLGHARGEPILVVRRGPTVFAVGAVCPHYSGPLAEGLIVDETVRCPWHHACFDLRTGNSTAPAFLPIPRYGVEQRGDSIFVGEKLFSESPTPIDQPERVVIVGAGPAGAMAAESLRRLGHRGNIVLLGAESTPPIDRTNLSKDYLAGTAPEEWMELRGLDYYREQRIDFRVGTSAKSLELDSRTVVLESGEHLAWDALVLATGADPVRLDLPGGERLQTLRTLADSRAIIGRAKRGKRAVVIGASFIGLEVAASLRARDVEVDIVGRETVPLERVLGRELGEYVQRVHEHHGVRFHLGRSPSYVEPHAVVLDDGTRLPCDFAVAGVGVKPRVELAEQAGLAVDRGIIVDTQLRATSDVYAIGDVARYPEPRSGERVRIEHWVVAQRQGEAVARTLLGHPTPFRDIPFFWSAHYDLTINYVGHAPSWDRLSIDGSLESRDAAVHYFKRDKLLSVATIGRDRYALEVERRFEMELG